PICRQACPARSLTEPLHGTSGPPCGLDVTYGWPRPSGKGSSRESYGYIRETGDREAMETDMARTAARHDPARTPAARAAEADPDPRGDGTEAHGVRSVQRALDILALLTEERPLVSIRDVVEATGLAKTTVIRLVQTLEQSGLLWGTASGYMAGPGLWRWAHLARRSWELPA